jgi:hypothetical protein
MYTNISEKPDASIFRVEESRDYKTILNIGTNIGTGLLSETGPRKWGGTNGQFYEEA